MARQVIAPELRVLILSGGLGSRSENPSLPKILQALRPNLDLARMHLSNLLDAGFFRVTFLLGNGAPEVISRLESLKSQFAALDISWLIDEEIAGTSSAVLNAVSCLSEEEYLLVLGDTAIQGNLADFVKRAKETSGEVVVAAHPNLHPIDSDRVIFDGQSRVITFAKKNTHISNSFGVFRALTGLTYFRKSIFAAPNVNVSESDITSHLLRLGMATNTAHALNCSFYLKDSGTPQRIRKIREDFVEGRAQRRGLKLRSAIFLDRDGTLIPDAGTGRKSLAPNDLDKGAASAISEVNNSGIPVFLVTNQPGIAKGEITFSDFFQVQTRLESDLAKSDAFLDDFAFCPHHPESGFPGEVESLKVLCACRKPKPGMIQRLANEHSIDLKKSILIGDTQNDAGAAEAAGIRFIFASHRNEKNVGAAIREALERILDDNH